MTFFRTFPAAAVGFSLARRDLVLSCRGIPALLTVAEILVHMALDRLRTVGAVSLSMPMVCL